MKAKPDPEVAKAINLARLSEKLNCLPRPGGILDQDSYTMFAMMAVYEADAEKERRDNPPKPSGRR